MRAGSVASVRREERRRVELRAMRRPPPPQRISGGGSHARSSQAAIAASESAGGGVSRRQAPSTEPPRARPRDEPPHKVPQAARARRPLPVARRASDHGGGCGADAAAEERRHRVVAAHAARRRMGWFRRADRCEQNARRPRAGPANAADAQRARDGSPLEAARSEEWSSSADGAAHGASKLVAANRTSEDDPVTGGAEAARLGRELDATTAGPLSGQAPVCAKRAPARRSASSCAAMV